MSENQHIPKSIQEWQDCFCGPLPTMSALRSAFVQLLRYCFSDPEHYSDLQQQLGCLTYKPEGGQDSISIFAVGANDPNNTNNIPGILVSFKNGVKYNLPAMRDSVISSDDFSQITSYTLGDTQLILSCSAYDADISCAMADACMLFIMCVKQRILQAWGRWIKDIRVEMLSEPHQKQVSDTDSSVIWYESQLIINIKFEYAVDTVVESKRLKGAVINSPVDN